MTDPTKTQPPSRNARGGPVLLATAALFAAVSGQSFAQTAGTSNPAPPYVVVQGEHPVVQDPRQTLTVLCPATHRALGVGYAALLPGPAAADGTQMWRDTMLDSVRTMPDSAGTGFLVEGYSAEAERTGVAWRLVVRVVCAQVGL